MKLYYRYSRRWTLQFKNESKTLWFFCNSHIKSPIDSIEYDFDKEPEKEIPSDWNTKDNKLLFFEGNLWFKKSFN